jgi:transposase
MSAPALLDAVAQASDRLHAAEDARHHAVRTAFEGGASLREIAKKALLSHEQVRRIVRDHESRSRGAYLVTVQRKGATPLVTKLLVRAPSKRDAGHLASCIAERDRGGFFEATSVRRAPRGAVDFDDIY